MMPPADTVRPRLADKARLKWDAVREKHLLLYPEGVLVLNRPRTTSSRSAMGSAPSRTLSKPSPRSTRATRKRLTEM